jgi:hypothetical protein
VGAVQEGLGSQKGSNLLFSLSCTRAFMLMTDVRKVKKVGLTPSGNPAR